MALGQLADENLALSATLAGGAWAAALPVTNLNTGSYLGQPARCTTPANLATSQFTAALLTPRPVSLVGVLFHTLSSNALYRVTVAGTDGNLATPAYQSAWTSVIGRLWDSAVLEWESSNWWTGQPDEEETALYPRHLWIPIQPAVITGAIKVEIDDHANEAGYLDIGGVWIARTFTPGVNFERGRDLGAEARSVRDEAPSGRVFSEERASRRFLSVTWQMLSDAESYRLFDAGTRAGTSREVLFVPDLEDPISLIREAFPATFDKPPAPKFTYDGVNAVAATFKEVIA
jgi:hypothetical protein